MSVPQSIYVIETLKDKIKIGITSNTEVRFRTIECQSGNRITNSYVTEKCNDACKVEHSLHTIFKENRVLGEWFAIDFESVVSCLKEFKLDTLMHHEFYVKKLPELPIHIAGWAIIVAFTKEPDAYTYSNLIDSIEVALDLFYKYSGGRDDGYREDPLLQVELMKVMHNDRVKRLLGKVGV